MHVLVAALDWGLGHAARSVPLVRYIRSLGHRVSLASNGQAACLWREEFPDLEVHELPAYGVRYAQRNLYLDLLAATPEILAAVRGERKWLREFESSESLDLVISDNRYGLYSEKVPSILLAHQLRVKGSWPWADKLGQFFLDRWISRFTEIWVPDHMEGRSLSGYLSEHGKGYPPVHRIGVLSRLHPAPDQHRSLDILVLLSGPEPQRSRFEQVVIRQLGYIPGTHQVVRGTREPRETIASVPSHIEVVDLLPARDLQALFDRSRMLVSRSGYSTLMDLETTGMPALLVPTPGQFEQEYLARRHAGHTRWIFQNQDVLDIPTAWNTLQRDGVRDTSPFSGPGLAGSRLDHYLRVPSA